MAEDVIQRIDRARAIVFDWAGTLWTSKIGMSNAAQNMIRHLHECSIQMAILSNTEKPGDAEWLRRKLNELDLLQYFEVVFSSADYGLHKPDPEAFYAVGRFFNLQPHHIYMIGDSKTCDSGSWKVGWQFVHVESDTSFQWAKIVQDKFSKEKKQFFI